VPVISRRFRAARPADSVTDDVPAVIAAAFDEAERRDPSMAESDSARR
jgi:hypothetical protein